MMAFTMSVTLVTTCLSFLFGFVTTSHFRGAVISWRPVDPVNYNGVIEITHRIAWRNNRCDVACCNQNNIDEGTIFSSGGGTLVCRQGCSGNIATMSYVCTDVSTSENWAAGQRSYEYNMNQIPYFEASFRGNAWISLVSGGGFWEVRVKGNLTRRPDTGRVNSSPITAILPVVRLQHGCNHTIEIPVEDVDGDDVRCRWSESSEGECAGVCRRFPATLNECVLRYEATGRTGWYAVALQIEDFASTTDLTPLSSVPVQFLVLVFTSSDPCSSRPEFVGVTRVTGSCVGIPFNTTYLEPLIVQSGGVGVSIVDIATVSPPGLRRSELAQLGSSRWFVNVTWSPTVEQAGPNLFCYTAVDSIGATSLQRCITLLAGVEPPLPLPDSLNPTGKIFPNHTRWSLQFDKPFVRSTRSRSIRIYEEGLGEVVTIDVSLLTSPVTYPATTFERTLTFQTNFPFTEKKRYYVFLDPGVAVGSEFCGAESPAIRDPGVWVVDIADVTPPVLRFVNNPPYSNENVTISWSYNEEATSICSLQSPTVTTPMPCANHTVTLTRTVPGLYSLYILSADLAGNVAPTARHTWTVDLTPPTVRLLSSPPAPSMDTRWRFQFTCLNEWRCTYACSVHADGTEPQYTTCPGSFLASGLQSGINYEFSVIATDGVGNVGSETVYQWEVDTVPPTISLLNDVSLTCGGDYSPEAIGIPVVNDNEDDDPTLNFEDQPSDGCILTRTWTAVDNAGNEAAAAQTISFTNPSPPQIISPGDIVIPCGDIEEAIQVAERFNLTVIHPCGRPVSLNFSDSTSIDRCGFTFTRFWQIQDDCGTSTAFQQNVRVLDQQLPDSPANGQVNVRLNEPLLWPQFPGANSYVVYVWSFGSERPAEPTAVVSVLEYHPSSNYPPGTRLLWQIDYVTGINTTVPSPIWGFRTQAFPDLAVTDIALPAFAFSGQDFEVSWTVINVGNVTTGVSRWADSVYIGLTTDFTDSRFVKHVLQNRLIDPQDGYVSQTTIDLEEDDIGNYYVFVETDRFRQVNEIDRRNNRRTSIAPVMVKLTPPPNLVVENVIGPESTFSGQTISISWTVSNVGVGITAASSWNDRIYWSEDPGFDTQDTVLGTYRVNAALLPGETYTRMETVSIPNAIFGNYSIVVVTDVFNQVYEHIAEDDNIRTSEPPVRVILLPPPDLTVSSLEADNVYTTGSTMIIHFEVTNAGAGEPFEPFWRDQLVLTSLSTGAVYVLGQSTHYGTLNPGNSYSTEVLSTTLPSFPSGRYSLTAHTDYRNEVFEFDSDGNNMLSKEIQIQRQLSDLVVSSADAVVQTNTAGNVIQLSYMITNRGLGPTVGAPWVDRIGLSHIQSFPSDNTRFLNEEVRREELPAGQNYTKSLIVIVPRELFGQVFLHIHTDSNFHVLEEMEGNNVHTNGPLTLPAVFPDLRAEELHILQGDDLYAGDEVQVNWTVTNAGSSTLRRSIWRDELLLSALPQLTPLSVKIADISIDTSLQVQESYKQSVTVVMPPNLAGAYYLFVRVDGNGMVDENGALGNNLASFQLYLSTPPSPDLRIHEIGYSFIDSARILTVDWTAQNDGNRMREEGRWNDQVFISTEPTFNRLSAIRLGHTEVSLQLEPFQLYMATESFVVPLTVSGSYFIHVEVDSSNDILEAFGEGNNIERSPNPVSIPTPPTLRLQVEINGANIPATLIAGQVVTVEYQVVNVGEMSLSISSWTDGIFLVMESDSDRDSILDTGIPLQQILNNRQLDFQDSYITYVNVTIPYGISQLLHLAVVVDISENLGDVGNGISNLQPVAIEQGTLPDLLVISPSNIFNLRGGQPVLVHYQVENAGEGTATENWYDAVYLSVDAILDPFDTRLKTVANVIQLEANETYNQTLEIFVPFDLSSGFYYLFFQADVGNRVFELREGNNFDHQLVVLQEAISTDIAIARVVAFPTELNYGDTLNFEWDLRNNGTLDAIGYKCDTVYLSEDQQWDITDLQIGNTQCGTIRLLPFEGNQANDETYSQSAATPFLAQRNYAGIVRTRSNIQDLNLENNIGFSDTLLTISAPTLLLDTPTSITLNPGDQVVFRIENVPVEETLIATLYSSGDDSPFHDLFLRFRQPPTGSVHDAFSQYALSSDQKAVVRNTKMGSYYIRIESFGSGAQPYEVSVLVRIAKFEILSIQPSVAAPLGNATLLFSGTLFSNNLQAALVNDANPVVTHKALKYYWFNSEEVYATFDMSSMEIGNYTARLTNKVTGIMANLSSNFRVAEGIPGQLSVTVRQPGALRAGRSGRVEVFIQNTGNTDLLTPMMTLQTQGNARLQQIDESISVPPSAEVFFLPLPSKGPGGVIRPGGTAQVYFQIAPTAGFTGREILQLTYVEEAEEPHIYLNRRDSLRPTEIPEEIWDTIWTNFLDSVGTVWASFHRRVSEVATEYSVVQKKIYSIDEIVNHQLRLAYGYLTGETILVIQDLADDGVNTFVPLMVERQYSTYIHKRRTAGPLGIGWILPWWELRVTSVTGAEIQMMNGRELFSFTAVGDGTYRTGEIIVTVSPQGVRYVDAQNSVVYSFDDNSGSLVEISSTLDNSTIHLDYNDQQMPQCFSHSNGKKLRVSYTEGGRIRSVDLLDENNAVERSSLYTYDSTEQFLVTVTIGTDSATYTYNEQGDLTSIFYTSGSKRTLQYNSNGFYAGSKSYSETGELTASVTLTHSWNGRLEMTVQPKNQTLDVLYDFSGRILSMTGKDGVPLVQVDFPRGQRILSGDEILSENYFDQEANMAVYIDANGNEARYQFGDDEELLGFTDSGGNTYSYIYEEGRLTRLQNPDGSETSLDYDNAGRIAAVVNPDDSRIQYGYDSNDNMIEKMIGNERITYEYNNLRRLTRAINQEGTMEITYDDNGMPLQVHYPNGHKITYRYNSLNQQVYMGDSSNGFNVSYSYNGEDMLSEVRFADTGEIVAQYEYGLLGELINRTLGNGAYSTYKYEDGSLRLLQLANYFPNGTLSSIFSYQYDRKGRIISLSTITGNWTYTYDATGQLIGWVDPHNQTTTITYDSRGNRVIKRVGENETGYSVNDLNQYTVFNNTDTFVYDRNGNLREKNAGGMTERYKFNVVGQLIETETPDKRCSYQYDPLGNLYRKNCSDMTSFQYLVDPFGPFGADIIAEIVENGATYFIHSFEQGLVAAMNVSVGSKLYYEFDGDGSVLRVLNEQGDTQNSYTYDPFGNVVQQSEKVRNLFLYIGKFGVIRDEELKSFYMMRVRHYDAGHGRYISLDPLGTAGNSLNLYTYAHNSPLIVKDPSGKIIPLAILPVIGGAALRGAGLGVGAYIGASLLSGSEITWGGVAGAAVSGAIGGAFSPFPLGAAEKIAIPVLAGLYGTVTEKAINGDRVTGGELVEASVWNAVWDNLPTKYLGPLGRLLDKLGPGGFHNSLKPLLNRLKDGLRPFFRDLLESIAKNIGKTISDKLEDLIRNSKQLWEDFLDWIRSIDPNDILGPNGFGAARFIPPDLNLEYRIRFENDPNATAPAQRVFIQHQLDDDLDERAFRVGTFGFGDFSQELAFTRAFLQETVNVTASLGVFVRVRAGIDIVTRVATWEFQALDPVTGEPPLDPSIGFLPPNNGTTGQGFVSFTVRADQQVASLSTIDAKASIVFDQNEPIDTPPIFNTIDRTAPRVNLTVIEELLANGTLAVRLHKADDGSGVQEVDIYQLTEDMGAIPLLSGSRDDVAILPLSPGSEYKVFASAVDNVGNRIPPQEQMNNFVLINYPITASRCISDCSGRGNCTVYATCECDPGYYGNDCSQDTPPNQPPILELSAANGIEDTPVLLQLSASPGDQMTPPEDLRVSVVTFPEGTTFSKGTFSSNTWTFTQSEFGEVEIYLPQHLSGKVTIEAVALTSGLSRQGSVQFSVMPVADIPYLTVQDTCLDSTSRSFILTINSSLVDTDGSENLTVIIEVPDNVTLLAGQDDGIGKYLLNSQELGNVTGEVSEIVEPFSVTITAAAVEQMNGDSDTTTTSLSIQLCVDTSETPETSGTPEPTGTPESTGTPETTVDSSTEFFEHPGFIAGVVIGSVIILLLLLVLVAVLCYCWFHHNSRKKFILGGAGGYDISVKKTYSTQVDYDGDECKNKTEIEM